MRFGVFSDESGHKAARFGAIAALSLPADQVQGANADIAKLLEESQVSEFKWQKVGSARDRICAQKLIVYLLNRLVPNGARMDVLVWDTHDRRHDVHGRDDTKNYERMYFHLHKFLMSCRPEASEWHLRPDELIEVDWSTALECLQSTGAWKKYCASLFEENPTLKELYRPRSLREVKSHAVPLVQIADLFAGIAAYSRTNSQTILEIMEHETRQLPLFETSPGKTPSNVDEERYLVVKHLDLACKRLKLGVSLRSQGYFVTRNPRQPVNFWHYVPQHPEDRAPTRDD